MDLADAWGVQSGNEGFYVRADTAKVEKYEIGEHHTIEKPRNWSYFPAARMRD
jgi:hypothetical protein